MSTHDMVLVLIGEACVSMGVHTIYEECCGKEKPCSGHMLHDHEECRTFKAAAQLRTSLECSGTMSFQLEGELGNSTSVLKILCAEFGAYQDCQQHVHRFVKKTRPYGSTYA